MNYFTALIQKAYLDMMLQLWISENPMLREYAGQMLRSYAEILAAQREQKSEEAIPQAFEDWFRKRDG